ncbi:hypothetical protein niasHS_000257 [Heterodera schachtii]|uniref:G protein-coupled receptor n=1 Tax=Heterodera schachtii TaxID=97005 RepID=A0ABD2KHL5_HETSC
MANLDNISFYLSFKDVNPNWPLISISFVNGTIAIFGIIFNLSIIWITVQTKSFRGTANYPLALCSFFELLHQPGHFLLLYTAFSGQNLIEYRLASKIEFIPIFGMGGITPTMFFTGIDRLIVIIFNEMHSKFKIRLYLGSMTFASVLYAYQFIFNMTFFYIFLATCIIYLFVGIVIKFKSAGLHSSETINHRVFRSLCCILTMNVGGYLITMLYGGLIKPSISSPITAWFWLIISAMPLNFGGASNGPILYLTSTEYRRAFQTEFPFVFKRISNQNRTAPQQNVQITRIFPVMNTSSQL